MDPLTLRLAFSPYKNYVFIRSRLTLSAVLIALQHLRQKSRYVCIPKSRWKKAPRCVRALVTELRCAVTGPFFDSKLKIFALIQTIVGFCCLLFLPAPFTLSLSVSVDGLRELDGDETRIEPLQ